MRARVRVSDRAVQGVQTIVLTLVCSDSRVVIQQAHQRLNLQLEPNWEQWWKQNRPESGTASAYEEETLHHREVLGSSPSQENISSINNVCKKLDKNKGPRGAVNLF